MKARGTAVWTLPTRLATCRLPSLLNLLFLVATLLLTPFPNTAAAQGDAKGKTAPPPPSNWEAISSSPDPTRPLLDSFLKSSKARTPPDFRPTGRDRKDYLKLLTKQVDFWKKHQDARG